ncbi:acyl-CoA thioesterase [Candidimonas sp. SYP-B2681]|uniref:acyl-CoA thioesterase n=1 Tax=Candidimonas sp. SYP-B2681 TaxID=2497686 RepID=UPI000F86CCC6|nr:thioesterase family protein [Candidimonas sp. SYP-B2681]RTZ42519.1 acyl-CoA thioesterase [Candidimonas sp. SYP-B2681]
MQLTDPSPVPATGGAFRYAMPIRWGDQDAQNHVNNTLYFRYFEEARVQLFHRAGIYLPSTRAGSLAHASCDFLKPLTYPATIVVTQVLTRVGRSSMAVDTRIERDDEPGVAYATGKYVVVGVDMQTGKSSPWTAAELAGFAKVFL